MFNFRSFLLTARAIAPKKAKLVEAQKMQKVSKAFCLLDRWGVEGLGISDSGYLEMVFFSLERPSLINLEFSMPESVHMAAYLQ